MQARTQSTEPDYYTRAANDDHINGWPGTRTKYTYDNNGNVKSRNGYNVTWTSYNHPLEIDSAGESVAFQYKDDHTRWSAVYSGSMGMETTYFIGDLLERVATAGQVYDYRHFIYAGGTKVAIYSRSTTGTNALHYVREDHLGGVSGILNSDGTSYVKESFTAFGARRSSCTWSGPPTQGNLQAINAVTRHGFTWQTALGAMGLNDMNGRIQDAVTGRFLSPDPTIPHPAFTQSYNRFSYVNNNPLTYIDPSGFADDPPPAVHPDPESQQSEQSQPSTVTVDGTRDTTSGISPTFAGPTLGSGTGAENGNGYPPGMTTDPQGVVTVPVQARRPTSPPMGTIRLTYQGSPSASHCPSFSESIQQAQIINEARREAALTGKDVATTLAAMNELAGDSIDMAKDVTQAAGREVGSGLETASKGAFVVGAVFLANDWRNALESGNSDEKFDASYGPTSPRF